MPYRTFLAEQPDAAVNELCLLWFEEFKAACGSMGMVEVVAVQRHEPFALGQRDSSIACLGDAAFASFQPAIAQA